MQRLQKPGFVVAAAVGCHLTMASLGFAQAWLPPKGEAWFSLSYGHTLVKDHYFYDGERRSQGQIFSHTALADLGYSITDRLGVKLNLPYVTAKYEGNNPHMYPVDDRSFHGTLTDLRIELRYNVLTSPFALTPFVAGILPSRRYEYFGHAITGARVKQLLVGTGFGRRLDPFLPQAYVQGRYSYAFAERIGGVFHDRSNLDLQIGYFVTPSVQLFVLGMGQKTHGGGELNPAIVPTWTAAEFHNHVRVTRSDLLGVGGGIDFLAAPTVDVFVMYMTTVAGRNDHAIKAQFTLGVTLGFSPRQVLRRMSAPESPAPMLAPGF